VVRHAMTCHCNASWTERHAPGCPLSEGDDMPGPVELYQGTARLRELAEKARMSPIPRVVVDSATVLQLLRVVDAATECRQRGYSGFNRARLHRALAALEASHAE
jgi:hypothetical protein